MPKLSIEVCSVFRVPPVEFVELAADLGCQHITYPACLIAFDNRDMGFQMAR